MKTLRMSFALIIAVLAVGVTVATKAGNRAVTRCFTVVTVTDGVNPISLSDLQSCAIAEEAIIDDQKIYLTSADLSFSLESEALCPPSNVRFCCISVQELPSTDPNYNKAADLDLGEGFKRYFASAVHCKPQQ